MTKSIERKPLSETKEKNLVRTIGEKFASESEEWRASAVIWGRKQMKFLDGLRGTKPPVPPRLQSDDRKKTHATLKRIADALGIAYVVEQPKKTAARSAADPRKKSTAKKTSTARRGATKRSSTAKKSATAKKAGAATAKPKQPIGATTTKELVDGLDLAKTEVVPDPK